MLQSFDLENSSIFFHISNYTETNIEQIFSISTVYLIKRIIAMELLHYINAAWLPLNTKRSNIEFDCCYIND